VAEKARHALKTSAAWIAAILSAALLAGCNSVVSTTPLFSAQDAQGQPQPRPGVWSDENTGCDFDHRKPVSEWPGCATGWVVRPGAAMSFDDTGPPKPGQTLYAFVLAKGDPAVAQITLDDGSGPPPQYAYAGVRPLKLDAQGRMIEYRAWPAMCGPPPPPDPTGERDATTTLQPIAGLVLDPSTHNCVATAQGPVRESVRLSEAWSVADPQGRDRARWVRDGER
jgi:hypothetical protein